MSRPEIIPYRDDWMLRDEYGDIYRLRRTAQLGDPLRIEPVSKHYPGDGPPPEPFVMDESGRIVAGPQNPEPAPRPDGPHASNCDARAPLYNTTGE